MSTENYGLAVGPALLVFKFIMPVMALQNTPNVTFRMPIYESYLPVYRDSSASIELTRYLGYQADTESTASAFSSVGKHH